MRTFVFRVRALWRWAARIPPGTEWAMLVCYDPTRPLPSRVVGVMSGETGMGPDGVAWCIAKICAQQILRMQPDQRAWARKQLLIALDAEAIR